MFTIIHLKLEKFFNPEKPNYLYIFITIHFSCKTYFKNWCKVKGRLQISQKSSSPGLHKYISMQNLLWPVCVWAHFSWHSLGSRTPLQSLLFCHRQTESWSQKRRQRQGWSCTFWQVSPWFQSWGLWPCRDAEHRQPAEKTDAMRADNGMNSIWSEEAYHLLPL